MGLPISDNIRPLLEQTVKKPQLILEIDGLPAFSSVAVGTYPNYDEGLSYDDAGLLYDGIFIDPSILPYIDIDKSTNQITQQMLVDKGGFSSVTSFDVSLVDKNQFITEVITPGNTIEEILSRKARLFLSLDGAGHPKDSILFFNGIVAGVSSGAGYVNINLASPEKLKTQEIFPKVSTVLSSAIDSSQTTITVESTADFSVPADSGTLRTYIKIDDEIIEYISKSSTQFFGCVRAQYGTIASAHDDDSNVESNYRLTGNLRDLCLKLMLSGENEPYLVDEPIQSFNIYGLDNIQNAIFVSRFNFDQYYGAVPGDIIEISGALNPSNNGLTTISSIVSSELGSYLVLNMPLITEGSGATFSLTSKYAVLPKFCGLEMTPDQVDVLEFESKYDQFSPAFFNYDFFISESVNGNEFINTQILYPSGAYSLPRKAKTSIGLTIPPLAQYEVKTLDETNTTSPGGIKISRNISNNFYNSVIIKYDKSPTEDKYLRGRITQSADSTNRIKIANKPLVIVSDGVKQESAFTTKFDTVARRFLERYKFAAESIDVNVQYGTGFTLELGDTVILSGLNITDIKDGNATRDFKPRLFEVQNKVLNLKGNSIKLSLVDTAFNLFRRYGVISPSSNLDSGSTTTNLKLKDSYGTLLRSTSENFKYTPLVGYKIRVFARDYSFSEETTITALDPANDNALIVSPALSTAPLENYVICVVNYPNNTDAADQVLPKAMYVYFNDQISVVSGVSSTVFNVSGGDLSLLAVGHRLILHDDVYTKYSPDVLITDITGNQITVDKSLGFTPVLGDKIEIMTRSDLGSGYAWL